MLNQITNLLGLGPHPQSHANRDASGDDVDFADIFASVSGQGESGADTDEAGARTDERASGEDVRASVTTDDTAAAAGDEVISKDEVADVANPEVLMRDANQSASGRRTSADASALVQSGQQTSVALRVDDEPAIAAMETSRGTIGLGEGWSKPGRRLPSAQESHSVKTLVANARSSEEIKQPALAKTQVSDTTLLHSGSTKTSVDGAPAAPVTLEGQTPAVSRVGALPTPLQMRTEGLPGLSMDHKTDAQTGSGAKMLTEASETSPIYASKAISRGLTMQTNAADGGLRARMLHADSAHPAAARTSFSTDIANPARGQSVNHGQTSGHEGRPSAAASPELATSVGGKAAMVTVLSEQATGASLRSPVQPEVSLKGTGTGQIAPLSAASSAFSAATGTPKPPDLAGPSVDIKGAAASRSEDRRETSRADTPTSNTPRSSPQTSVNTSASLQSMNTLFVARTTAVQQGGVTAPGLIDVIEEDTAAELLTARGETRGALNSQVAPPIVLPQRVDHHAVLRQVADAVSRMSDGTLELRLSPEELGTVRMSFANGDHGLMVTVQADRPETLDLLRRHIDQLARDLADAGYEDAGFQFGDGRGEDARRDDRPQDEQKLAEPRVPEPTLGVTRAGLDITL